MQPAVHHGLGGGAFVVDVALEHGGVLDDELAVLRDLPVQAVDGQAGGAQFDRFFMLEEDHPAGLGHAVDLVHRNAEDAEELQYLGRDAGAATEAALHAVQADEFLQIAKHQQPQHEEVQAIRQAALAPLRLDLFEQTTPGIEAMLESPALKARGVLHADQNALLQLLPDARHAQKHRGCDLAQIDGYRVDRFGVIDHATGEQVHDRREGTLGHVAQRQVADHFVVVPVELEMGFELVNGDDQVAVRQHRALGRPGGARGVDQHAGVIGLGVLDVTIKGARVLGRCRGVLVS